MIKEAIILAGGLGTRLQGTLDNLPKSMAPVNGKPFLEYLFNYLIDYNIEKVILSVGHKYESIQDHFQSEYKTIQIKYAIENEPLGTGGGIKYALKFAEDDQVLILNGDTFFEVNLNQFYNIHQVRNSDFSIALKPMKDFDRYGSVELDEQNMITAFKEKSFQAEGCINGGIYILHKEVINELNLPDKCSFEKDFMEKYFASNNFYGFPFDGYFIDIGIPEDYEKAQKELQ